MLSGDMEKLYPSAKTLVKECVASRLHAKDATLYGFSDEAQECAQSYMGWTDLATNPPYPLHEIQAFADSIIAQGLKSVVLIGQGGSTQAPMTITKYHKPDSSLRAVPHAGFRFPGARARHPVRARPAVPRCSSCPRRAGGTIEPRLALARRARCVGRSNLGPRKWCSIWWPSPTPAPSSSSRLARRAGPRCSPASPPWAAAFSALSVFGLLPAALVGIDLEEFMAARRRGRARRAARTPSTTRPSAWRLSCTTTTCRAATSSAFLTQKRGRVLGLWIEQLVAESAGQERPGHPAQHRDGHAAA